MAKSNIELDVKVKCIERGRTRAKVAEGIDTTRAYVSPVEYRRSLRLVALTVQENVRTPSNKIKVYSIIHL